MNTDKWTQGIDRMTAAFQQEFGRLSPEQLNRKPDANTWSIAQNIEHLIRTNESYYPGIEEVIQGKYKPPFTGKLGFLVRFFGKAILKAVQPSNRRKTKTFPVWEPTTSDVSSDILDRFGKHQESLKREIVRCGPALDRGARISSPANRNIVYDLGAAFDILVAHEERHLQQAKEAEQVLG